MKSGATYLHEILVLTIPAYNEAAYIAQTIASVRAQTWTDFVAVISDNASTDETGAVCREAIAGDLRFHYYRQPKNIGASGNFMWLLNNSSSPLFMWLGAHDLIAPDYLASHVPAMLAEPRYSLSYSLTKRVDGDGNDLGVSDPGSLADLPGGPVRRFFKSIPRLGDCTAINNVLRREAIGAAQLDDTPAPDAMMLSSLLFWGPARRVDAPQYVRRCAENSVEDYMERLTGRAGLTRDENLLLNHYLATFDRLVAGRPSRLTRPLLKSLIERRLFKRPFRRSDWVHNRLREIFRLESRSDRVRRSPAPAPPPQS